LIQTTPADRPTAGSINSTHPTSGRKPVFSLKGSQNYSIVEDLTVYVLTPNSERIELRFDMVETGFFLEEIRDGYRDKQELQCQNQVFNVAIITAEITA
jgi:hypothetical protein